VPDTWDRGLKPHTSGPGLCRLPRTPLLGTSMNKYVTHVVAHMVVGIDLAVIFP
jgi:hypothetical protein